MAPARTVVTASLVATQTPAGSARRPKGRLSGVHALAGDAAVDRGGCVSVDRGGRTRGQDEQREDRAECKSHLRKVALSDPVHAIPLDPSGERATLIPVLGEKRICCAA
jgi:hypothetical protein